MCGCLCECVCVHTLYVHVKCVHPWIDFLCSPSLPNMEQYFVHVYIHTYIHSCTHSSQYTKSYAFTTYVYMYVYTVFYSYLTNHPDTLVSVEVNDCREMIKNGLQWFTTRLVTLRYDIVPLIPTMLAKMRKLPLSSNTGKKEVNTTVDSCFGLIGPRQCSVAQGGLTTSRGLNKLGVLKYLWVS